MSAPTARASTFPTPTVPPPGSVGPFLTWPNLVTAVRTVVAVALGAVAVARGDLTLVGVAYAVYWVGDIADGAVARRLGQETRTGAVLDIVGDRACTVLLATGLLVHLPEAAAVMAVFLVSFAFVDTMLSLAFLCWPLLGPNDFHVVDQVVWRLNWSPPAKAVNTAGVVVAVLAGQVELALVLVVAVLVLKVWSLVRVAQLLEGRGGEDVGGRNGAAVP